MNVHFAETVSMNHAFDSIYISGGTVQTTNKHSKFARISISDAVIDSNFDEIVLDYIGITIMNCTIKKPIIVTDRCKRIEIYNIDTLVIDIPNASMQLKDIKDLTINGSKISC